MTPNELSPENYVALKTAGDLFMNLWALVFALIFLRGYCWLTNKLSGYDFNHWREQADPDVQVLYMGLFWLGLCFVASAILG